MPSLELCDQKGNVIFVWLMRIMSKQIFISRGTETVYIPVERVFYFEADGNYTTVVTLDGRKRIFTYQLGEIVKMIQRQLGKEGFRLARVGRGLIVNVEYVHVVDEAERLLALSDCKGQYYELTASQEALKELVILKNKLITEGII